MPLSGGHASILPGLKPFEHSPRYCGNLADRVGEGRFIRPGRLAVTAYFAHELKRRRLHLLLRRQPFRLAQYLNASTHLSLPSAGL